MFQVNQLETQLQALSERNKALEQRYEKKEEEAQGLRRQVKELQDMIEGQPMQQVMSGKIYQPDLNFILEEQINSLTQQVGHLKAVQQRLERRVAQEQMKCGEVERELAERQLEVNKLRNDLEGERNRAAAKQSAVEKWREQLTINSQERLRLVKEKEVLAGELKKAREQNCADINEVMKRIEQLSVPRQAQIARPCSDNSQQVRVMELMQQELDDRNREIHHLNSIYEGHKPNTGDDHLKNTVKHLRGELTRYKNIASKITQKMMKADEVIKQYQQATQRCNLELRSLEGIVQKNKALRNKCDQIAQELELSKVETIKAKDDRMSQLRNLKTVILENQCLHQFLFENYGESAEQLVEQARSAISPRIEERSRNEQWASIEQLIQVNSRLKARCKVA